MDLFTEVYNKSADLLKTTCFHERWSNIEPKMKALLTAGGPNDAEAAVLELIRTTLHHAANKHKKASEALADDILALSRSSEAGFQERAALLKTLKHFYFVTRTGNQSIWVCDGPKAYHKWTYDVFDGKTAREIKGGLQHDTETFGKENHTLLSQALQLARKWSMDIEVKLSKKDEAALKAARRWFHTSGATDADVEKTIAVLLAGFKKIAAVCNSTRVIFSDRPHKRVDRGYATTLASVNPGDAMPVIYIFKAFIRYGKKDRLGRINKLWYCALTIVHELSHKLAGTDDIQYDDSPGLKPGATFTTEKALKNADSWAYFAADLVGALPEKSFKATYK